MFNNQKILPAVRTMKEFDRMLKTSFEYGVILNVHINMLASLVDYANRSGKKMFLHADLVSGLKTDEAGTEFLCQTIKPYGIISTKGSVVTTAKQKGVVATQRAFILDSSALERSINIISKTNPDYVEVLPGVIPKVIRTVVEQTGKPVFAGGLIDTAEEVEAALAAGASAITTSNYKLWDLYDKK
ncbi:glycerol-3-phosphate responsive antiterminator [Brochothrix campestris]|uniref:glycerol-3-phosphate responsive antiterminator n=1 Tax=Brochothrix campestris TaxID=2757 RepID=UPI0038CFC9B0